MSDLQCPATLVLISPETATSGAQALRGRVHLAGVFIASAIADDARAAALAARLASEHGCRCGTLAIVDAASLARAAGLLADLHRGETVVVLAASSAIRDALGWPSEPAEPLMVEVDSSGWTLVR